MTIHLLLDPGHLWRAGYLNWVSMSFPFPLRQRICKILIQVQDLLVLSKHLVPLACLAAVSTCRYFRVQQIVFTESQHHRNRMCLRLEGTTMDYLV